MSRTATKRNNTRNRILLAMEATGKPMSREELDASLPLKGLTSRSIGHSLTYLLRDKTVHLDKRTRLYALATAAPAKTKVIKPTSGRPDVYFVLYPEDKTLELDVRGIRFPVYIEDRT